MRLMKVISSALDAVGYDPATQVLEAKFKSGGHYEYLDVPESVFTALMQADSKGTYFERTIRDQYRFRRLRP